MLILSSDGSTRNFCGIVDQKNLFLPIPPLEEQKTISQILQKKVNELDLLVVKEADRINLLKEYRQSLISSTVTGKVRVKEDII
jgi:restriction endonuclease S subunit